MLYWEEQIFFSYIENFLFIGRGMEREGQEGAELGGRSLLVVMVAGGRYRLRIEGR